MSEEGPEEVEEWIKILMSMPSEEWKKFVEELECLEKTDVAKSQTTNTIKTTDNDKN